MSKERTIKRCGETKKGRAHTLMGVLVFVFGFFWFSKKVGWIPVAAGGSTIFWPAVVMFIGLAMVLRSRRMADR
jgi:hypothetical protein